MNPLNPRTKRQVRDIVTTENAANAQPGWGIILAYDAMTNSATVLMSSPGGDDPGEIYAGVPCPIEEGIQSVAPRPGRSCNVVFKHGNTKFPIIISFFNYNYRDADRPRLAKAPMPIPRFMLDM